MKYLLTVLVIVLAVYITYRLYKQMPETMTDPDEIQDWLRDLETQAAEHLAILNIGVPNGGTHGRQQ